MKIRDLIERLEEYADTYGDDTKVKAAIQPSYPLAAGIWDVTTPDNGYDEYGDTPEETVVYLVTGDAGEYAPSGLYDR